jgi:protein-tyrosine-phosphatase
MKGVPMPTSEYLEQIESKLDSLRTDLMYIVAASRDTQELNEKIIQLSQKYKEPEILELIMYVNSSITIDLKQLKESLVKAVDTVITLKKEHIRQIKTIESRLRFLEVEYETYWKGNYPTGTKCEIHDEKKQNKPSTPNDELSILGFSLNSAKLKILGVIWAFTMASIVILYTMVAVNKEAVYDTVDIVKQGKEIVKPVDSNSTEGVK